MEGVPDLSALLKGQLRLLATKDKAPSSGTGADPASAKTSLPADPSVPEQTPEVVVSEPGSAVDPAEKKKKKKKTGKKRARDETASNEADVAADVENRSVSDPSEEPAPSGSLEKKKRRKKKRSGEDPHVAQDAAVDPSLGIQSEENPRDSSPPTASPGHDTVSLQEGVAEDGGCPAKKKNAVGPPSSAQSAPQLGGSGGGNFSARGLPPNFRDKVNFSYDERTPLILNPPRCAELTRQIRGAPAGLPPVEELAFKELYTEVACSSKRNEANMNMLVAAYEGELRHTVVQLAAAEKLARVRQLAIDRVKGELKEVKDKAIEDKEILRGQFEKLEDKLKSSQFSRNRLSEENAVLRKRVADLEEQNASIAAELASEGKRLRDSRVYEVTQERVRVLSAMIAKANVRFNNIRDRESRRGEFDLARNLYGQAMGTKNCLELILNSGAPLTQEHVDMFAAQEKQYAEEVARLTVMPISESDLSLSPLVLPSPYVDENALASLDLFGSNVSVMNPDAVALLQRSEDGQLASITEPPAKAASPPKVVISDGSSSEEEGEIGDSPSPLLVNCEEGVEETAKEAETAIEDIEGADSETHSEGRGL
ncbi:Uncharacterized protein Rs2_52741 [Raphanus sativus]|nr:Uncharacterized protein Rs2_52741 [Raphanus sativus]